MIDILNIVFAGLFALSGLSGATGDVPEISRLPSTTDKIEISSVRLTGYNAVVGQTNDNPRVTASGAYSNPDIVIARSRDMADILPYGTIVALHRPTASAECGFDEVSHFIGYRVVLDTMHKRKERQMDVMFDTRDIVRLGGKVLNPAVVMGVCEVSVRVVGYVDIADIPKTQSELMILIEGVRLSMK